MGLIFIAFYLFLLSELIVLYYWNLFPLDYKSFLLLLRGHCTGLAYSYTVVSDLAGSLWIYLLNISVEDRGKVCHYRYHNQPLIGDWLLYILHQWLEHKLFQSLSPFAMLFLREGFEVFFWPQKDSSQLSFSLGFSGKRHDLWCCCHRVVNLLLIA